MADTASAASTTRPSGFAPDVFDVAESHGAIDVSDRDQRETVGLKSTTVTEPSVAHDDSSRRQAVVSGQLEQVDATLFVADGHESVPSDRGRSTYDRGIEVDAPGGRGTRIAPRRTRRTGRIASDRPVDSCPIRRRRSRPRAGHRASRSPR